MPPASRFQGSIGCDRRFVDRDELIAVFAALRSSSDIGLAPVVFNPAGVGGIGKSRLLRQLREHACAGVRTASLDLRIPAMRQQEDALSALRLELSRQGVRFDRFDIAYAVLWQRLHPHLQLSRAELPFIAESEILGQLVDSAAGLSVFGTAIGLVQLAGKLVSGARRRHRIHTDETLNQLGDLSDQKLVEALTFLFAGDLRDASDTHQYAVFIDTYEALAPSPLRSARVAQADVWLRDLVAQLDRGVTVIASREPLGWARDDPEWGPAIHTVLMDALPEPARVELLAASGVRGEEEQREIADASAGLPFYLNLALDTRSRHLGGRVGQVVSHDDIVRRFLQHVGDREARILEVLAVCRVFDFEIFQRLARRFNLPDDRLTWETLTAYSFVSPAGTDRLQLHQVMRDSLCGGLPAAVRADADTALYEFWRDRTALDRTALDRTALDRTALDRTALDRTAHTGDGAGPDHPIARSWRELVYHGLRAGRLSGADVLAAADAAFRTGGRGGWDGILNDLRQYLALAGADADPVDARARELEQTAACLAAEGAVRLSKPDEALAAGDVAGRPELATIPGARLATAIADARRTLGDTALSEAAYQAVWDAHQGPARNPAGIWLADLAMCRGQFLTAVSVGRRILAAAGPDDLSTAGGVHRLLHLTFRFGCEFTESASELDAARDCFRRAADPTGQAKIATNTVELFAWTDSARALRAGAEALELQGVFGNHTEIGKIYTAMAVAHLGAGQVAEARAALYSATQALDRARYRSGRARAELIRACVRGRMGDLPGMVASAQWAVAELVSTDVYPTLRMLAELILARCSVRDPAVTAAAHSARAKVEPLGSLELLTARLSELSDTLFRERPSSTETG